MQSISSSSGLVSRFSNQSMDELHSRSNGDVCCIQSNHRKEGSWENRMRRAPASARAKSKRLDEEEPFRRSTTSIITNACWLNHKGINPALSPSGSLPLCILSPYDVLSILSRARQYCFAASWEKWSLPRRESLDNKSLLSVFAFCECILGGSLHVRKDRRDASAHCPKCTHRTRKPIEVTCCQDSLCAQPLHSSGRKSIRVRKRMSHTSVGANSICM